MVTKYQKLSRHSKFAELSIFKLLANITPLLSILVSLDPDDEKLLEEEPVNLPDKKRFDLYFFQL